ncbi:26S proteasome non-ATPase regulatory subunit-like protein [Zancudomyces culisetae]|uniref:26S proteasome non-ATPase regulatory subunit-like protein n=1 Tax=Zancudomyces culisetae TaxID=1213189 RepID=A0A1R1PQL0_ZANCU|nr:26S proteasome non-ATPase regulatory subunit-like protein [Zancudomyces culisetae]|eukprot:OMH83193.1 26S proteasome non-ATPase regulatory subunit-like protein [Zancudomyces culisetae]
MPQHSASFHSRLLAAHPKIAYIPLPKCMQPGRSHRIDNSEYSRNGDYSPTRFQAQIDAVHFLFNAKTQDNPESTVGVMAHGGENPEVLVTLTNDTGGLLKGLHRLKVGGDEHFEASIQVAQLVLKHRANKNQRQRIVIFAASPIGSQTKDLVKLAKKLKKNNVSVDVINFGEYAKNEEKLQEFVNTVDAGGSSTLLTLPPGPQLLSDQIRQSPMFGGMGGLGDEFGMDGDMDPELALALKMSLEEEMARQRAVASKDTGTSQAPKAGEAAEVTMAEPDSHEAGEIEDMDMLDEEEQIRRAIQLSLQENEQPQEQTTAGDDSELVSSLLESLPGVDTSDPSLQKALEDMKDGKKSEKK